MTRRIIIFVTALYLQTYSAICYAQINCGDPPALPMKLEDSEKTKAELSAKVQAILRAVGSGEVEAVIDRERRTLYQSADKIAAAQQDAYMLYMACTVIARDGNLNAAQALDLLAKFRRPPPITKFEQPQNQCLASYTKIPYTCPEGRIGYIAVCTWHICDGTNNGAGSNKVERNVQCKPVERGANVTYKGCTTDKLGFVQTVVYPKKCVPNQYGGEDCTKRTVNTAYCISVDEAKKVSRPEDPIASNQ